MSVRALGENLYGIVLEYTHMNQGWGEGKTYIYGRVGDTFQELLSLVTSLSDPDGREWDSKMILHPRATGLYDIEFVRSGKSGVKDLDYSGGGKIAKDDVFNADGNVRPRDTFKFDGQKYRRIDSLK